MPDLFGLPDESVLEPAQFARSSDSFISRQLRTADLSKNAASEPSALKKLRQSSDTSTLEARTG